MAKRLTDTKKWNKLWYRKLSPESKCFWQYICDNCSNAGIWDVDFETAAHFIGKNLNEEKVRAEFEKQYIEFADGKKWYLKDFIPFQYGKLKSKNVFHIKIKESLQAENLPPEILKNINTLSIECQDSIDTPQEKDNEVNRDVEKHKEKHMTPLQIVVNAYKVKTGHDINDKAWDKLNFARFGKPAKQLLEYFGNWRDAVQCMDEVSSDFKRKNLSFTLETCCKWAADWKIKREKDNAKRN